MKTTGTRVVVLSQLEHPFIRNLGIPGWFGHDAIGNRVRFLTARRCSLWIQVMPFPLNLLFPPRRLRSVGGNQISYQFPCLQHVLRSRSLS